MRGKGRLGIEVMSFQFVVIYFSGAYMEQLLLASQRWFKEKKKEVNHWILLQCTDMNCVGLFLLIEPAYQGRGSSEVIWKKVSECTQWMRPLGHSEEEVVSCLEVSNAGEFPTHQRITEPPVSLRHIFCLSTLRTFMLFTKNTLSWNLCKFI